VTTPFATATLPEAASLLAPDGSEVRLLLGLQGGGMAHFRLAPGQVARAVIHRTVEEVWYITDGAVAMWRRQGDREEVTALRPGLCLTIPAGTQFGAQFRVSDAGLPNLRSGRKGDLVVIVRIETPRKLNKEQERLLREFAATEGVHGVSPESQSFWKKVKNFLDG
jgi:hypothetical protein